MIGNELSKIGTAASSYIKKRQIELVRELTDGISGALVWLVRDDTSELMVLKVQAKSTEGDFYTSVLPLIDQDSKWTPVIYDSCVAKPYSYILMEYIAKPWDSKYWNKDNRALKVLAELHATEYPLDMQDKSIWSRPDINRYCKFHLPDATINQVLRIHDLYLTRNEMNRVICSGDPNPLNWLEREDGSLVLVDWQNGTVANCALDLAGWVSTYLSIDEVRVIATRYSELTNLRAHDVFEDTLIFMTRRWCLNFKMAKEAANPSAWDDAIKRLSTDLPTWIDDVASQLEI